MRAAPSVSEQTCCIRRHFGASSSRTVCRTLSDYNIQQELRDAMAVSGFGTAATAPAVAAPAVAAPAVAAAHAPAHAPAPPVASTSVEPPSGGNVDCFGGSGGGGSSGGFGPAGVSSGDLAGGGPELGGCGTAGYHVLGYMPASSVASALQCLGFTPLMPMILPYGGVSNLPSPRAGGGVGPSGYYGGCGGQFGLGSSTVPGTPCFRPAQAVPTIAPFVPAAAATDSEADEVEEAASARPSDEPDAEAADDAMATDDDGEEVAVPKGKAWRKAKGKAKALPKGQGKARAKPKGKAKGQAKVKGKKVKVTFVPGKPLGFFGGWHGGPGGGGGGWDDWSGGGWGDSGSGGSGVTA